jgi:uncharacterized protein (DUF433 family)
VSRGLLRPEEEQDSSSELTIYNAPVDYQKIVTVERGKGGGRPCIRGMRITVYDVLSYLASGMTHQEILADFPYLTEEDILACLSYAADREHHLMVSRE